MVRKLFYIAGQIKRNRNTIMTDRKRKIICGILAAICIVLGLMIDRAEEKEVVGNVEYYFRNEDLLEQHFEKHGMEMGFESMEAYEAAASAVVYHPDVLTKTEAEDGDYVYYVEETNEFVIISPDGYIRTYFNPSAGIDYFNRQ